MITGYEHIVQISVFLKSIGAGFVIGLLFSFFSVLNLIQGKNTVVVCIRDIIFFLISAVFTFLFALKYNAGIIRFYLVAGELIGFCLCYLFTCNVVRTIADVLLKRITGLKTKIAVKADRLIHHPKISSFLKNLGNRFTAMTKNKNTKKKLRSENADNKNGNSKKIRKN